MNRHHKTVLRGIFRHDERLQGDIHIRAVCRDTENTVFIFSSGCTYSINKSLVPLIQALVLLAAVIPVGSPAPASVMDLVEGLKYEEIALVLELFCDLSPHGAHLIEDLLMD